MGVVARRSTMTFFSDAMDHYSHRLRIVLAEKGVAVDIVDVDPENIPDELRELNPYANLPTLVDRDLTIYQNQVMMEYLDERFPHPPLLPVYPVARAEIRQFIYRVENDWCPRVDAILRSKSEESVEAAKKDLRESLIAVAPIFADKPFFMSSDFSLVDCCLAPILWRLSLMGITLPQIRQTQPLFAYMQRVFARPSFVASLTEREREIKSTLAMT